MAVSFKMLRKNMLNSLNFTVKSSQQARKYCVAVVNQKKSKWKSVVGLEVHAQINTESKLFSGSKTAFGAPLNSCVSLFDASIPGTLPTLNRKCVEAGIKTALALECRINPISMFDRKHYFYADLPAGYQITQQRAPLANDGKITFPVFVPGVTKKPLQKSAKLHQLQLEQDSGKSLHDEIAAKSLVDLNRAGIPLMELVFEPDLVDGEEAAALVKELILILRRLGTCSCRMEEGALRVDANISIHQEGEPLGIRTEIKNIGSVRNVAQAVTFEIHRQIEVKNSGGIVNNETRSWDALSKKTIPMRDKEVQQDYRFMPEPNLPPLHLDLAGVRHEKGDLIKVSDIKCSLPELPEKTRQNLIENYHLTPETAIILVNEPILLNYFSKIVEQHQGITAKTVANLLINDLLTLCNKNNVDVDECKIKVDHLIEIVELMQNETINLQIGRVLLQYLHDNPDKTALQVTNEENLFQINDPIQIEKLCEESISKNAKAVQQYKKGKKKVLFAIAGDVVKLSEGKANMAMVVKKLEELLK